MKKIWPLVVSAVLVALLVGSCSYGPSAQPREPEKTAGGLTVVRVGTTEGAQPYWDKMVEIGKAEGIDIQVTNFTDYVKPNPAVANGELDLNLFQHLQFLAQYNVDAKQTLTPIAATYVVPLNVYSSKHKTVDAIPAGGTVAVPNDPSNLARALLVLADAGLVSLRDGGNSLSGVADVLPESKVKVQAVDASQTVVGLKTVDAAVINNNFLADANIDPSSAIYVNQPDSDAAKPYINVIVSREADKDNPTFAKVAEIFHRPEVEEIRKTGSGGTAITRKDSAADLQAILTELQTNLQKR